MKFYSLSTSTWVVGVETDNDIVVRTAPKLKKFIGQKIYRLFNWVKLNFKDVIIKEI